MASLSQSRSNHRPFLKLSKVCSCCCCAHCKVTYKIVLSLVIVLCILLADMAFIKLSKFVRGVWVLLADLANYSQFPSNYSPFSKLSKLYPCCVHAASTHGQLFSVFFKAQLISQTFQSLIPLCD